VSLFGECVGFPPSAWQDSDDSDDCGGLELIFCVATVLVKHYSDSNIHLGHRRNLKDLPGLLQVVVRPSPLARSQNLNYELNCNMIRKPALRHCLSTFNIQSLYFALALHSGFFCFLVLNVSTADISVSSPSSSHWHWFFHQVRSLLLSLLHRFLGFLGSGLFVPLAVRWNIRLW
jgi:hypothetical protein